MFLPSGQGISLSASRQRLERLIALRHLYTMESRGDRTNGMDVWTRIEELVARHPALRFEQRYLAFLRDVATNAGGVPDVDTLRRVEQRVRELLADPAIPATAADFEGLS